MASHMRLDQIPNHTGSTTPVLSTSNASCRRDSNWHKPKESKHLVAREWMSDALRAFDRVWYEPQKTELPSRYQPREHLDNSDRPKKNIPESRHTQVVDTYSALQRTMTLEQSHRYWDMTKQPRQPLPKATLRFYRPKILNEKLLGPENYKDWAKKMKKKLEQCGGSWITNADPEVPSTSNTRGINPSLNLWMMIFSNVSRPIRRDLGALRTLDAQEAWRFLERTCARHAPMKLRSVMGLRDIMNIKYDDCNTLKEYIDQMVLCSRAIQCNREKAIHGGKDETDHRHLKGGQDNEWLWCQFILVGLGPEWECWVVELVQKFEGQRMNSAISTFKGLFPIIEAEEARRIQASRYMKHCSA